MKNFEELFLILLFVVSAGVKSLSYYFETFQCFSAGPIRDKLNEACYLV